MLLSVYSGAYKREAAFLPELRMRNLLVEQTPADDERQILMSRPGLVVKDALQAAFDVKAVYCEPGTFGGATVALCGPKMYIGGSFVGDLTSLAQAGARFASNNGEMVFCNAGSLYRCDGTTLSQPAFPDSADVVSVAFLDEFFLAARANTGKFYWSAVGDGTSWPALNFATAESHPDNILDILTINDQFAILGESSIEFWGPNPTGDANLPFSRVDGLTYSKGVLNTGAAVYADNTLIWVGNDGIVYRRGAVPQRISDHGVEASIKDAGTAQLFTFTWAGHTLMALVLPGKTLVYDFESGKWPEFSTYGRSGWRAQCGCANGLMPVFGDSVTGNVLQLDDTTLYDVNDMVERRFTALGPSGVYDNIRLDAQAGIGQEPLGDPIIVEMSSSRDGGQTFGPFTKAFLGKRGEWRKRAVWRRCGLFDRGAVFDFRTTDPALFSLQSIRANEPLAGRST
jgi:hypothetical protein